MHQAENKLAYISSNAGIGLPDYYGYAYCKNCNSAGYEGQICFNCAVTKEESGNPKHFCGFCGSELEMKVCEMKDGKNPKITKNV